jgi:signal transduction histidine kinase
MERDRPATSREHSLSATTVQGLRGDIRLLELNRRINWFLSLRLAVGCAILLGALLALTTRGGLLVAPTPLFLMSAALFLMNGLFWLHYRMVRGVKPEFERFRSTLSFNLHLQILFDFGILSWMLVETGGVGSPVTYFFLFHVSLSCLFFRRPVSFFYTALALILIIGTQFLIAGGNDISVALAGTVGNWCAGPGCGLYYVAGVVMVYGFVWYLASTITTSLRQSEADLQANIDELVEMHREKTRYMLTTTHELKAPFTAIHSYANVLLGGYVGPIDGKVEGILTKIRARCERMLNMINELLQLANIKNLVKSGVDLDWVDLGGVVRKTLENLEGIRKGLDITIDTNGMGSGPFWILGDSERLEILFSNIIANALYYSHPGSTVTISFTESENMRRVTVADEGIGIKQEHLEKVFLEHFRTEEAVGMNSNSTGLGLTICKFIIYMHQGRIWLESEPGSGTTAFMEFLKERGR